MYMYNSTMSTKSLIEACQVGQFPSFQAMSEFGINNTQGIDPVQLFKCYQLAINNDNLTYRDLTVGLKKNTISPLILSSPSVFGTEYEKHVSSRGGIQNGYINARHECDICAKVSKDEECYHT